jgi:hypothetical protein
MNRRRLRNLLYDRRATAISVQRKHKSTLAFHSEKNATIPKRCAIRSISFERNVRAGKHAEHGLSLQG